MVSLHSSLKLDAHYWCVYDYIECFPSLDDLGDKFLHVLIVNANRPNDIIQHHV